MNHAQDARATLTEPLLNFKNFCTPLSTALESVPASPIVVAAYSVEEVSPSRYEIANALDVLTRPQGSYF
ncbi:MAG: hypothetical protein DMF74_21370 [Acidobacteria bacterium]|nr:MAG: hypothetical protein DMF74_21370 [Acidobacteriota bacterium]